MWKVLIVENDLDWCNELTQGLNQLARCIVVRDGCEAIQAYEDSIRRKATFDFIILELNIEPLTGFEVIQHVRQFEYSPNNTQALETTIIVVSSYHDSLLNKYNTGWDDFITKPLEVDKMIGHMRALKMDRVTQRQAASFQQLLLLSPQLV